MLSYDVIRVPRTLLSLRARGHSPTIALKRVIGVNKPADAETQMKM